VAAAEQRAAREVILLRKKAILLRYTHAAKVIQRAVRKHLSEKKAIQTQAATTIQQAFRIHLSEKREQSAFILQRSLRNFKLKQEAKRVVKKLRLLSEISSQVESFRQQYESKVLSKPVFERNANTGALLPNKDYLVYEDALLKALIKLDGVLSEGFEVVRDKRKWVIATTQRLLTKIDEHKQNTQNQIVDKEKQQQQEMEIEKIEKEIHGMEVEVQVEKEEKPLDVQMD